MLANAIWFQDEVILFLLAVALVSDLNNLVVAHCLNHGYELTYLNNVDIISVAGMDRPELKDSEHVADYLVEPIKDKMRTILRIASLHGHDCLVLGALGCGAFRNPPAHIARMFHEVFDEPEFKGRFSEVYFAILEDHNSHKAHNPKGNFKPFLDEFAGA